MDLTGRAVIVTGSSSGIGEAVARRLSGLGAGIVVNSASSAEAGQRVAAELADAVYVKGDIGDPATADELLAPLRALGPVNDTIQMVPTAALLDLFLEPEQPVAPSAGEHTTDPGKSEQEKSPGQGSHRDAARVPSPAKFS